MLCEGGGMLLLYYYVCTINIALSLPFTAHILYTYVIFYYSKGLLASFWLTKKHKQKKTSRHVYN